MVLPASFWYFAGVAKAFGGVVFGAEAQSVMRHQSRGLFLRSLSLGKFDVPNRWGARN